MIFRIFFYLIGFGFTIAGGVTCIAYLNLITTSFTFSDYLQYISTRIECYLLILGICILIISIFFPSTNDKEKTC